MKLTWRGLAGLGAVLPDNGLNRKYKKNQGLKNEVLFHTNVPCVIQMTNAYSYLFLLRYDSIYKVFKIMHL